VIFFFFLFTYKYIKRNNTHILFVEPHTQKKHVSSSCLVVSSFSHLVLLEYKMSDTENIGGASPIDRSKRPRFETEEWDSDYEQDNHDDRHPKRQAVPDPETKAPHFVPVDDKFKKKTDCAKEDKLEDDEDGEPQISLRSLVGTKDAGVIIGRAGKNVSEIRDLSAARVTISEIVQGAYERILTVTGPVQAVAKVSSSNLFKIHAHSFIGLLFGGRKYL
jgi:predicted RNA-binding protein YlqC (UPF0109 family)